MLGQVVLFIATAAASSVVQTQCNCGTDASVEAMMMPVFAEDPMVTPGMGFATQVSPTDVMFIDGECLVHNSYPDVGPGEPTYIDPHSDVELVKVRWERPDGTIQHMTLEEVSAEAQEICFGF